MRTWFSARWLYVVAFIVWASIYLSFRYGVSMFPGPRLSYEQHAQIGDLFGAFTSFFAVVAALLSIETNKKQAEELALQRFHLARESKKADFAETQSFLNQYDRFTEESDRIVQRLRDEGFGFSDLQWDPVFPEVPFLVDPELFEAVAKARAATEDVYNFARKVQSPAVAKLHGLVREVQVGHAMDRVQNASEARNHVERRREALRLFGGS